MCADGLFERVRSGQRVGSRDDLIEELKAQLAAAHAEIDRLRNSHQNGGGDVAAQAAQMALAMKMMEEVREQNQQLLQERESQLGPVFSECLQEYLDHKRQEKGRDHRYVEYTIPNSVAGFIDAVGDRRLGEYRERDLEEYGFLLARVPANKAKLRIFRDMSLREAADYNDGLRKPYATLAKNSILRGYLTPLRGCMDWLCTHYDLPPRWRGYQVKAPKSARVPQPRESLTYQQLCTLFEFAWKSTQPDRPEDKWLPILGFFTGARLSEMVHLQGRDIRKKDGTWIIDLTRPLIVSGVETPRPTKTTASERHIALHGSLEEAGFIEFAKNRAPSHWLFRELHKRTEDPADAASKRVNRLIKRCGLDERSIVFHSLRHTAKDWLRDCGFNPRDTDLQIGHALSTVSERYGRKLLRKEQLEALRELPLPEPLSKIWPPK